MNIRRFFSVLFLLIPLILSSQDQQKQARHISKNTFSCSLSFLSSGWMEGREAGEKGSFLASDYIASMMELYNLQPYGDRNPIEEESHGVQAKTGTMNRSCFQTFDILRYKAESVTLSFISQKSGSQVEHQLFPHIDFKVEPGLGSVKAEVPIVFAGYHI